jgi:hypothetical protein
MHESKVSNENKDLFVRQLCEAFNLSCIADHVVKRDFVLFVVRLLLFHLSRAAMPNAINPPTAAYFDMSIKIGQCAKCSGLNATNPQQAVRNALMLVRQFGPNNRAIKSGIMNQQIEPVLIGFVLQVA